MPGTVKLTRTQRLLATITPSIVVVIFAALTYIGLRRQDASRESVAHTHQVIEALQRVRARLVDAETGQRGYLLTGEESYLGPYATSERQVQDELATLRDLTRDDAPQEARIDSLDVLTAQKYHELDETIDLRRSAGLTPALGLVESNRGKQVMDHVRRLTADIEQTARNELAARRAREVRVGDIVQLVLVAGTLLTVAVALLIGTMLARYAAVQQEWAEELERTADALRASEERLRLALGAGRLGPWEWDTDAGTMYWSPEVEAIHGLAPGSFAGTPEAALQQVHPDDRERARADRRVVAERHAPYEAHYRIVRPDGEVRWVEARGQFVPDRSGAPHRVVGVMSDITERHRAEEHMRFIAEASVVLASSVDYEQTLASVAQLAVPTLADWCAVDIRDPGGQLRRLAVAHPDPAKVASVRAIAERYPADPKSETGAYEVLRTGRSQWMSEIPAGLLDAAARDDEHRRMIHELGLRSYMSVPLRTREGVLGVLTLVSAESGRRYTKTDVGLAEDLAGRAAVAIERSRLMRDIEESREQLENQAQELEMQTEELQTTTEELARRTDESENARREAEDARQAAEAANLAKSQFLATMSHELRTPLNAIGGYVDLLAMGLRGPTTEAQLDDLRRIKKSGQHLLSLINDILNLSRIEAGRVDLNPEDVSMASVLDTVETLVAPQMRDRGLIYRPPRCDPALVAHVDAEKVQQILLNLLTNAIKFTEPGGEVHVECEAAKTDSGAGAVSLRVRDTGRGIPADRIHTIFEPFVQIDRHLTQQSQQGVGLGLSISRELARTMGGDLAVESTPGEGSTFTLTLPGSDGGPPAQRESAALQTAPAQAR